MSVTAADVEDNRIFTDGYDFHKLSGTELPFEDGKFDIVITNHVIEHVGEETEQINHLNEIKRILKSDGMVYLAVPNRWMLIEPHYKLAFLSWLPRRLRSHYLRWKRGIAFYDCEPLSLGNIQRLLDQTGFHYQNKTVTALLLTLQLEYPEKSFLRLFFSYLPTGILEFLKPVIPTLIFRLTKSKPS